MKTAQELVFFEPYSLWYYPWWESTLFSSLLYAFCIVLCIALVVVVLTTVWKRYTRSYWYTARKQLTKMQELPLTDGESIKQMYSRLTVLMKEYLSHRYKRNYAALTDQEALEALKYEKLTHEHKEQLTELFSESDPIKFAHEEVLISEAKRDLKQALNIVQQTKP